MKLRFINSIPCRSCGLGRGFLMGVVVGLIINYVFKKSKEFKDLAKPLEKTNCENFAYHRPLRDYVTSGKYTDNRTTLIPNSEDGHTQNKTETIKNSNEEIRVLCWILTGPKNHLSKAIHVKKTWGKRCDKLLFMSSTEDPKLPSIGLPNVKEGRDWLWAKTKEALKYIYTNHLDDADWFLKADDDTYVIMENLKDLLKNYNTNSSLLIGHKNFKWGGLTHSYMDGGAGYVMSKEALKRFVEKALKMTEKHCYTSSHEGAEDVEVAKCLLSVNTSYVYGKDSLGRERFNSYSSRKDLGKYQNLSHCSSCSDTAISFHYIQPYEMYYLEFLMYHLRVGIPDDDHTLVKIPENKGKAKHNKSEPKSQSSKPRTTVTIQNTEKYIISSTTAFSSIPATQKGSLITTQSTVE